MSNIEMLVTAIDYRVEQPSKRLLVNLYGRDSSGARRKVVITDTKPYFYIPLEEESLVKDKPHVVAIESNCAVSFDGKTRLSRVILDYPFNTAETRHGTNHHEADVTYDYRVRYDMGIKSGITAPDKPEILSAELAPTNTRIQPVVSYIDIEVSDNGKFAEPENPTSPVLSVSMWDTLHKTMYVVLNVEHHPEKNSLDRVKLELQIETELAKHGFTDYKVLLLICHTELILFKELANFFGGRDAPDILVGWNSWEYDFKYLSGRYKKVCVGARDLLQGIAQFDLMFGYSMMYRASHGELESKKLQYAGEKELKIGKIPHTQSIWQMYHDDIVKFSAYNAVDVVLTVEIDKKMKITSYYQTLVSTCGAFIDDVSSEIKLIESCIFHRLHGMAILPSRGGGVGAESDTTHGGHVVQPSVGIFNNVIVLDLKAEYPSIIRTFNISPDAIAESSDAAPVFRMVSGISLRKEPRGFLTSLLDDFATMRTELQRQMKQYLPETSEYDLYFQKQTALKFLMNSVYGILSNKYFRLAHKKLFNAVSMTGQEHVKWMQRIIVQSGLRVLYGDTDSILILCPTDKNPVELGNELVTKLNATFAEFAGQYGFDSQTDKLYLRVDFKTIYSRWFQIGTKKKYCGQVVWSEGKDLREKNACFVEVKGFEYRRSNSPDWTRKTQKELFDILLTAADPHESVIEHIKKRYKELASGAVPIEQLGIPVGIGKDEYESSEPIHIRAFKYSVDELGLPLRSGDKIKFYFCKEIRGHKPTDVVAFLREDKVPDYVVIDLHQHIRRVFVLPFKPVLSAIGIDIDEIISGQRKSSLNDF